MGRHNCFSPVCHQKDINKSYGYENYDKYRQNNEKYRQKPKISAEMRIETVEAIQTINFSPKNLTMIHWTSSLSQLSVLG